MASHPRQSVVAAVLARYPLDVTSRRLLAQTHNTTFRLKLSDGSSAVLKITPPRDADAIELRSEMQWLDALSRQTDLLVPRPIRNRSGGLVTTVRIDGETWHSRVMTWVPGRRLGRSIKPKHFAQLGELIARLHEHAGRFRPPRGFARPRWEVDFEGRFANLRVAEKSGRLSRKRLKFFEAARRRALRATKRVGRGRDVYGLIHSDLGFTNHLFHHGRAGAIDFETCAYGWFLHDLAEPLVFLQHSKHFQRLRDALLEGYRGVRPLSATMEALLPDFIDFSALTSLGYIAGEPTRAGDLGWFSRYLEKVLRKPADAAPATVARSHRTRGRT
jgi:Ser/Thr protein kinase RdoA (MazF antagonist)